MYFSAKGIPGQELVSPKIDLKTEMLWSIGGMRASCPRGSGFDPTFGRRRSDGMLNRGLICVRMLNIKKCTLKILTLTAKVSEGRLHTDTQHTAPCMNFVQKH